MGSLMPEKMTGQSRRTQSICQKQPSSPLAWSLPHRAAGYPYKAAPPKEGVLQEARMDSG